MKRLGRWTEDRVATAYTGLVSLGFLAAVLGPSLIGARTLISVNSLTGFFPWRANGVATTGHERCTGDTIDSVMPSIAFVRSQWWHGHLGAWQGLIGGGSPMAALPNLGLLDPLSLPYLVLPLWLAPGFVKLLELVVSGGGTYLFLRRHGVSRPAGILAGLIFGTSGFMVMWSNWPQTRVAALIPPLFWAVERLVQRRRGADSALIAVIVAALILGGFPAVTAWALELAAVYFLVRLWGEYRHDLRTALRGLGLGVLGIVVGGLLAMVQLLPFIDVYAETNTEVRNTYGLLPLATTRLLTLVDPGAFGLCVGGEPRYDASSAVENVTYLGAAALVLAIVGACVRYRRADADARPGRRSAAGTTAFFTGAAAVIIAIAYTSSWFLRELQPLPPFGGNSVGRIRSVLGFVLAVLAGFGFDAVVRRRGRGSDGGTEAGGSPRRFRPSLALARPAILVCGAVLFGVLILIHAHRNAINAHFWPALKGTLYVPALLGVATLIVLALSLSRRSWTRWLAIVTVPLLVAGQGGYFFHRVLPGDSPANFYPRTDIHAFLQTHLGDQRYDATGQVMYPSTSLYYGLRAATGHTSQTSDWVQLLRTVDPGSSLTPTFTAFSAAMTPDRVGASRILDRLGVEYWVFSPDVVSGAVAALPAASGSRTVPAGGSVSCQVPAGPLRGISVRLASALDLADVTKPAIMTVVADSGGRIVTSARAVVADLPRNATFTVAVPGEGFTAATTLSISVRGAAGPVALQASGAAVQCAAVRPVADGLRLVYAGAGAVVYQRLSALPRIRWTGKSEVIAAPAQRLAALAAGVPADTVVLDSPAGTGSGQSATVQVQNDSAGIVTARVAAQGAGYLTVADAMTSPGWSVTVDGRRSALLVGDHALGTVAVPGGTHTVTFQYSPPGFRTGLALTGFGVLALAVMVVFDRRRGRSKPGS